MRVVDTTYHDFLLRLAAVIHWRKSLVNGRGKIPSPGFFRNVVPFESALHSNDRTNVLRLANLHCCYACNRPVNPFATGDHIIPKSIGGSHGAENYGPMCTKCNSSKGTRDALEWLAGRKSFNLQTMNLEILITYTRQMFVMVSGQRQLGDLVNGPKDFLIRQFASTLPTPEHRDAFWAITGNVSVIAR